MGAAVLPAGLGTLAAGLGDGGAVWSNAASALALVWVTVGAGDGFRRSLDGGRTGAEAWLSGTVAGISALLVAGFVLGSVGQLALLPLLGTMATIAGVAQVTGRRADREAIAPATPGEPADEPGWLRYLAAGGVALSILVWAGGAYKVFHRGVVDVDSHHYHLSHALRFAQTGRILPLHHVWSGDLAAYHPSNDELLRAMGMLAGRSDLTGVVWNAVPILAGLLAAFVVGRSVGRPATAILVASAALTMPGIALPFAGGASNDLFALSMLLAATALAVGARDRGSWLLVGAAAGIALGTKLTVLPAVAVLLVMVLVLRDRRALPVRTLPLAVGVVLTGALWYLRNSVTVGNPVPGLDLPGPLALNEPTAPTLELISHPVARYVADGEVVRQHLLPGLRFAFGPLWPVVLALALAGIAAGIEGWRRGARSRDGRVALVCAVVAAVTIVAYVLTPTSAGGSEGDPWLFKSNLRYLLPATVLGTMAALVRLDRRWTSALGLATAAVAVTGALDAIEGFFSLGAAVLAAGVAALAALALWRWPVLPLGALAALGLSVGMIAAAGPLRGPYLDSQYQPLRRMGPLYLAVRESPAGTRVGVAGLPEQYGYAGRDLQNTVQYLGEETADGGYLAFDSCDGLTQAVRDGGYDFLAVNGGAEDPDPPMANLWVRDNPAFELVESTSEGSVYRVIQAPDPSDCEKPNAPHPT